MIFILWLLRAIALFVMLGAFGAAIYGAYAKATNTGTPIIKPLAGIIIGVLSFLVLTILSSATYIDGTHRAVVENTLSGRYKTIGPGFHIWPLQPDIVPFTSKVTQYNMRRTRIEIGKPDNDNGRPSIAAGSSSPGNPVVYIHAAGWATPNPERLVDLHRRFGADYANNWVESNWVTTLKAVQGQHPFNFLNENRDKMSVEVEDALQKEMFDGLSEPLVNVTQLAIINFDFEDDQNDRLRQLAQKQNETEIARQDQLKAEQERQAELTRAQTRLDVAAKDAEKRVTEARGEAEAIRVQNEAITNQGGLGYIFLKWVEKWDGKLPQFAAANGADGPIPFFNLNPQQ